MTVTGVTSYPPAYHSRQRLTSVAENVPSMTITVNRTGDMSEAISVDYTATNGTAMDGEDFTAASGTLNWAANDSEAKTFSVQVMTDSAVESDETVQLALTNPSTNTGLEGNTTAVLTITDVVDNTCSIITEWNITADTTLDQPCYQAPNGIIIDNSAKLTIEPGVRLEFAAGTQLEVKENAYLDAVGTNTQPIIFSGQEATPGYWQGIYIVDSYSLAEPLAENSVRLEYVAVEYGVNNIEVEEIMSGTLALTIKNSTLRNASDLGLKLQFGLDSGVVQFDFENNTLTGNGRPVSLYASKVRFLDTESDYTGNADDTIHVSYDEFLTGLWKNLGVSYFLTDENRSFEIRGEMIVEAGVTIIFNSGSGLKLVTGVNHFSRLTAIGTATDPITFTGLEQTPSYWQGIHVVGTGTYVFYNGHDHYPKFDVYLELDYVTVEYGGGWSYHDQNVSGNISVIQCASFAVTNSTMQYSNAWGLYGEPLGPPNELNDCVADTGDNFEFILTDNIYLENELGDIGWAEVPDV
ncbi:MAG: hypothetical protein L3J70_04715 [Gammaproteobacteria bacterium]|nr:hypothetical protein [Gammaproteobacteria bacterium]